MSWKILDMDGKWVEISLHPHTNPPTIILKKGEIIMEFSVGELCTLIKYAFSNLLAEVPLNAEEIPIMMDCVAILGAVKYAAENRI